MPFDYTPGGLTYNPTVTLPLDGDGATAASVNAAAFQYLAQNSGFFSLLLAKIYNVKNYGAVGDGSTDDLTAFQNAMSDASSNSGGSILYVPQGYHRLSAGLNCTPAVSLVGDPFSSFMVLDHATANFLTFNSNTGTGRPATRISNLGFGALTANTGTVIYNTSSDMQCIVDNCDFNGGTYTLLNGKIFYNDNSASRWTFTQNNVRVRGNVTGFLQGPATAQLNLFGNTIAMPSTYSGTLVYTALGGANIGGNSFDVTAQSSGSDPTCISVSSGSNTPVNITGNRFFSTTGSGPTKFALSADGGTNVILRGNSYQGVNHFNAVGTLVLGSDLELLPANSAALSGTSYTLSDGVADQSVRFTGGTAPTITLPNIFYPGQRISITVWNSTGSPLGVSFANYGFKVTQPTIANNGGITATFVAGDPTNTATYSWVQIGDWGQVAA